MLYLFPLKIRRLVTISCTKAGLAQILQAVAGTRLSRTEMWNWLSEDRGYLKTMKNEAFAVYALAK